MALSLDTEILGQVATSTCTYCYLYEPLRVTIEEDDLDAKKIYIDLEIIDTTDDTVTVELLTQYGDYDINPGNSIGIDLMKLAQQHHDANVFNFSNIDDIITGDGWKSIISEYKYRFRIYSDLNPTPAIEVFKLPIIGGRNFSNFTPAVPFTINLSELQENNIDLLNRWIDYPYINNALVDASLNNSTPILSKTVSLDGVELCGGYLIWKSRKGGWSAWGFKMKDEDSNFKYMGNLETGLFESTQSIGGSPFIETNYTSMEFGDTLTLKDLSLTKEELLGVRDIKNSPAIYYVRNTSGDMELMRLSSASIPLSNLSNGGDFSVSLKSISKSFINTK